MSAESEKWRSPGGETIVIGDYIKGIQGPANVCELVRDIEMQQKMFAGQSLPAIAVPFVLPAVRDVSDNNSWTINGRKINAASIRFLPVDYLRNDRNAACLETRVRLPRSLRARILICGKGVFRAWLDGSLPGEWSAQSEMVPAFHRHRCGQFFEVDFVAGKTYSLRIEVCPVVPASDLVIAFGDPSRPCGEHLYHLEYLED